MRLRRSIILIVLIFSALLEHECLVFVKFLLSLSVC